MIGALLGTQSNRDVSIVNSFELILGGGDNAENGDVDMGDQTEGASVPAPVLGPEDLNLEFLERRRDQCMSTLLPVNCTFDTPRVCSQAGLPYPRCHRVVHSRATAFLERHRTTSSGMSIPDSGSLLPITVLNVHGMQFLATVDSPLFLLFDPDPKVDARDIPVIVYEATLNEGDDAKSEGKFLKLDYAIETGEAERIAVDGVSRGGLGEGGESTGELRSCVSWLSSLCIEQSLAISQLRETPSGCSTSGYRSSCNTLLLL